MDTESHPRRAQILVFLENHRIFISRVFVVVFFGVVMSMESRLESTIAASVLFITGLALVGVATIGRLWCSLYISGRKDTELITVGPYSVTRNPSTSFPCSGSLASDLQPRRSRSRSQ